MSADELERLARTRAARQLLHRPTSYSHPADILRAIAGIQSQDPPHGRLGIRARHPTLTTADVERARTEERSIIRLWAMRNTAHLVATDELPILRPLFTPIMAAFNRRRLAHFGVDADAQERGLDLIAKELDRDGPMTRTRMAERLAGIGIELDTQYRGHIYGLAVSTGVACLGPGDFAGTRLVATNDWLPDNPPDLARDRALTELTRRYFAAFGPATEADFAGWAGLPLGDVRSGIAAAAADLRQVEIRGSRAWQPKGRAPRAIRADMVRLLPAFDNYLMGHRDRDFIAPPKEWAEIGPGGGILYPAITTGGAAVGTWRLRRPRGTLEPELLPFGKLNREAVRAVAAELEDVGRFEGKPVGVP